MNNEAEIIEAIVKIGKVLAQGIIGNLKYDYHFSGQITYKNENGTFEVFSDEKNSVLHNIKWSTATEPSIGDNVLIRETIGVPDSYMIDYIEL